MKVELRKHLLYLKDKGHQVCYLLKTTTCDSLGKQWPFYRNRHPRTFWCIYRLLSGHRDHIFCLSSTWARSRILPLPIKWSRSALAPDAGQEIYQLKSLESDKSRRPAPSSLEERSSTQDLRNMVIVAFLWLAAYLLLLRTTIGANIRAPAGRTCPRVSKTLNANPPDYACTDSFDWRGDGYKNEDCLAVVQRFFYIEVARHHNRDYEFLAHGTMNKTNRPIMATPRRYIAGQ